MLFPGGAIRWPARFQSGRQWAGNGWFGLFTHNLDHDFPRARMVQFDEKYALISPKLHQSVNHRHGLAGAQEQMLQVSMAVGCLVGSHIDGADTKIIVGVAPFPRRKALKKP